MLHRKVFKSASGLAGHLKSTAHGDKMYRCPYCLRIFKSMAAITNHSESSANRCQIRETDNYNAYLDQLTAGMVDVSRERNEDGTLKYVTTETAKETFRGKKTASGSEAAVTPREENWETWEPKNIKW